MRIVFFNHYHNGDIHVSREIVKKIMHKAKSLDATITFTYSHHNDPCLLADIQNLDFESSLINNVAESDNLITIGDSIYINTWYGQRGRIYLSERYPYGTMDSLYTAFDISCKALWNFSLADISTNINDFFPTIDYSKFYIGEAKTWLQQHTGKKVFVGNGHVQSGQSRCFDMTEIIIRIANKHPDIIFILTNKEGDYELPPNVIYSSTIINKPNSSDLNENAFISSYCDVIVGRNSGPSTFAMTQENLFHRRISMIYFTDIGPISPDKFWAEGLSDRINYTANIICTNEVRVQSIQKIIEQEL